MAKLEKSAHEMLNSPEFKQLVSKRWSVSVVLTVLLFVLYYGYVLIIGYNKALLATRIGETLTLGIPIGVGVIILSWVLTVVYVLWANNTYDSEVQRLKDLLK